MTRIVVLSRQQKVLMRMPPCLSSRHWTTTRLAGSAAALRIALDAKRTPMLLIDVRPQRYHYVVAIGVDANRVLDAVSCRSEQRTPPSIATCVRTCQDEREKCGV
jgi:hypothetical protein